MRTRATGCILSTPLHGMQATPKFPKYARLAERHADADGGRGRGVAGGRRRRPRGLRSCLGCDYSNDINDFRPRLALRLALETGRARFAISSSSCAARGAEFLGAHLTQCLHRTVVSDCGFWARRAPPGATF